MVLVGSESASAEFKGKCQGELAEEGMMVDREKYGVVDSFCVTSCVTVIV